jgi:hypothetical protein
VATIVCSVWSDARDVGVGVGVGGAYGSSEHTQLVAAARAASCVDSAATTTFRASVSTAMLPIATARRSGTTPAHRRAPGSLRAMSTAVCGSAPSASRSASARAASELARSSVAASAAALASSSNGIVAMLPHPVATALRPRPLSRWRSPAAGTLRALSTSACSAG